VISEWVSESESQNFELRQLIKSTSICLKVFFSEKVKDATTDFYSTINYKHFYNNCSGVVIQCLHLVSYGYC